MTPTVAPFDVTSCPLEGINLVEASAGTGKTWNICGLYLRLLLERGLPVRNILVVTFTIAATAELRERVRERIVETLAWIDGTAPEPGDAFVARLIQSLEARGLARDALRGRLDLALQSFDEASIFTIHGFCHRALADAPFSAAVPFVLDLAPDDSELVLDAVNDFWRRHVAADQCPPMLATHLLQTKDSPRSFGKLLRRRIDKPMARSVWPDAIDDAQSLDAGQLEQAYAQARATWQEQRNDIVTLLSKSSGLNKQTFNPTSFAQSATEWDDYFRAFDPLAPIDPKTKLHLCRASRLKKGTNKNQVTPRHPFFDQAEILLDARTTIDQSLSLARLALLRQLLDEALVAVRESKRERRLVSYNDILYNLYAALHEGGNTGLADSLRKRFPAALIDEFQDTDPLQFAIFDRIYGAGKLPLFLVGDPKQAIYSFRNADLYTYLAARKRATAVYTLVANHRSTPGLIAAVNALFSRNARALVLPGLEFFPTAPGGGPRAALDDTSVPRHDLCVWMLPTTADGEVIDRNAAKGAAVQATASEIARLLRDAAAGRATLGQQALRPSDIAVLTRTHAQATQIRRALGALRIGSVELSQQSVFQSTDAEDLTRVLMAILEPPHGGLLRAALATELMGCDASAVAAISADENAMMAYIERFADYRDTWVHSGIGVMLRGFLTREQVSTRMLERPDGERRLTNLLHLSEWLHRASEIHGAPDALLRWLQTQCSKEVVDEVAQLRLESDQNLIQIVTVHAAKGLEYPVVFCPFLWDAHRHRNDERGDGLEYHDTDGTAVIDFRSDAELADDLDAIKQQRALEECAETVRLIYVALTRASHRCYLVAGCYGASNYGVSSSKESSRGMLNWLVAGDGTTPEAWLRNSIEPQAIAHAWATLATSPDMHLQWLTMPAAIGTPIDIDQPTAESLHASPPPARIDDGWRISSFSGLYQGAVSELAAADHDARAKLVTPSLASREAPPADLAPDDVLRFPRGTSAGDCIHAVFERADFTDASTWDGAIARALSAHPMVLAGLPRHEQQRLLTRMLANMLDHVLRTELPGGIRLDTVPLTRRLVELEFSMPSPHLSALALNDSLRELGYPVSPLAFRSLDGYLKGFIDLVFVHGERYYVLDWKSNHLGYAPSDYGRTSVERAMAEHGYHLQHLLYSIALTRYLARRVRDYRYDAHFGGVFYLFVRGVRPTWRTDASDATGVYFHRPTAAALQRLDTLLDRYHAVVST